MTETPSQIALPTFGNLATFSIGQLEAMLIAWEWIRDQPDWALWHEGAKIFMLQLETELERRQEERSRLALRQAITGWCMANNRTWGPINPRAAADAVEEMLTHWRDSHP